CGTPGVHEFRQTAIPHGERLRAQGLKRTGRSVPGLPFGDRSRPLGVLRSERPERRVRVRVCWVYSAEDHLARTGSGRVGSAARNVG
ncbi:MAG: hypothetical protein QOG57_5121, partial [Pseudonocardiales bacterium]|nr:hypothetical protein [Pseudonocardiales bacterium]